MPVASEQLTRPLRVLIVEDESRLRDLLADVIPDMGYAATATRTAEEALKVMEAEPHHMIILDLQLPMMHGMQFFEIVRSKWPATQVIIVTGNGDLETAREAIHLDVVDFLSKPCHLKSLELSLDRARRRVEGARSKAMEAPHEDVISQFRPSVTLEESERVQILATLRRNAGNRTATAAELGISRRTLHYKLNQYQEQGFVVDP